MTRLLLLLLIGCTTAPAATRHEEAAAPVAPPPQPVQRTAVISSLTGIIGSGWVYDFSGFAGTSTGCVRSVGAGRFVVAHTFNEGDRLLSMIVAMVGNGSADVDITSLAVAPNGDRFLGTLGSLTQPNVPPAWTDYPIDLVDTTVAGGVSHWIEFGATASGLCVGAVRLTYEQAL